MLCIIFFVSYLTMTPLVKLNGTIFVTYEEERLRKVTTTVRFNVHAFSTFAKEARI